jgi:hypothetical protein
MTRRNLVTAALLAAVLAVLAWQCRTLLADPTIWPPDDTVEYWAAARLQLAGADPYAPAALLPLERAAGRDTAEAVMMWNPPWTLTYVLPLGALPPRVGQLAWLFVGIGAVVGSVLLLRAAYATPATAGRFGPAAAAFVPIYLVLQAGQIGPLLLLGAAGFAFYARRGQLAWAGVAAVLLSVKPHLAYLLWVAMVADAVARRRVSMLAAGVAAGSLTAALPLLWNADVYGQYLAAMRDHPPAEWVSLTLGTVLRVAFGAERFGLQFVPLALGLGWFAWHWWPRRQSWDWAAELPKLLLASFLTSPYGAWHFDLVLLLVAVLHRAADPAAGRLTWAYLAFNALALAVNLSGATSVWYGWFAPALLALYAWPVAGFVRPTLSQTPRAVPA